MQLPEGVRAFFLLNAANVSEENERLARAICETMYYDTMKGAIKKIFGDPTASDGGNGALSVKAEPIFMSEHESAFQTRAWRGRGRGRGYSRGGGRQYRRSNPVGRDGKMINFFKCNSTQHFSRNCDKVQERNDKVQEIHITLLNADL